MLISHSVWYSRENAGTELSCEGVTSSVVRSLSPLLPAAAPRSGGGGLPAPAAVEAALAVLESDRGHQRQGAGERTARL